MNDWAQPARRALLLTPIAIWCWLSMALVHELGHVAAVWLTGGRLVDVELRPGRLPHTLAGPNPRPSLVVWAGLMVGWLAPLGALACRRVRWLWIGRVAALWSGFCLLAGGVYLAIGPAAPLTDTGQLVALSWPVWLLASIGVAVAALGYAMTRDSIIRVAIDLGRRPVRLVEIAFWWAWLIGWCIGQQGLAAWLA